MNDKTRNRSARVASAITAVALCMVAAAEASGWRILLKRGVRPNPAAVSARPTSAALRPTNQQTIRATSKPSARRIAAPSGNRANNPSAILRGPSKEPAHAAAIRPATPPSSTRVTPAKASLGRKGLDMHRVDPKAFDLGSPNPSTRYWKVQRSIRDDFDLAIGHRQRVQRVVSEKELRHIQQNKLLSRTKPDGTRLQGDHYVSTSANSDMKRAQQRLGLGGKLREYRVTLDVPKSRPGGDSRIQRFGPPERVPPGPDSLPRGRRQAGGGTQLIAPGHKDIPVKLVKVERLKGRAQ